jgi:hypothetical protein
MNLPGDQLFNRNNGRGSSIGLSLNARALVKHVEPYGSQEHSQHHDCHVYGDPDCQYCQLAPHIRALPFCIKAVRLHMSCVAREHRQGNDGDGYRDVYKELDHHFAHHARTLPFCVSIVIHSRGGRGSYSRSEFRIERFF